MTALPGVPEYAAPQLAAFFAPVRRTHLPHDSDGDARRDEAQEPRGQAKKGAVAARVLDAGGRL